MVRVEHCWTCDILGLPTGNKMCGAWKGKSLIKKGKQAYSQQTVNRQIAGG